MGIGKRKKTGICKEVLIPPPIDSDVMIRELRFDNDGGTICVNCKYKCGKLAFDFFKEVKRFY